MSRSKDPVPLAADDRLLTVAQAAELLGTSERSPGA
jgi:hypothetical protein